MTSIDELWIADSNFRILDLDTGILHDCTAELVSIIVAAVRSTHALTSHLPSPVIASQLRSALEEATSLIHWQLRQVVRIEVDRERNPARTPLEYSVEYGSGAPKHVFFLFPWPLVKVGRIRNEVTAGSLANVCF